MKKWLKEEGHKVFYVAAFLFVSIFFVLPYLVQTSTYFHEKAHQRVLDSYGVANSYQVNLLSTIHKFYNPKISKLGVTRFDLDAYNKLTSMQKAQINIAGIVSDLRFLFLIGIFLALLNIYVFYKVKFREEDDLTFVLALNWILFMWLLALIQITVSNLTFQSGDFVSLVRALG